MNTQRDATRSATLQSALSPESPLRPFRDTVAWCEERKAALPFHVERTPLDEIQGWITEQGSGDIVHISGKFFRVEGVMTRITMTHEEQWDQPIINQPEVGILGYLTKVFDGVRHFLAQAKREPGNITKMQLSPTVQATKSNYTQVHRGTLPPYLEYFVDSSRGRVLYDQLQSEQGARFLRKRNRNIIIEALDDVPVSEDYLWMTLGEIRALLRQDNLVNMDSRTVLSCVSLGASSVVSSVAEPQASLSPFGAALFESLSTDDSRACHPTHELISWFTQLKCSWELQTTYHPLASLPSWRRTATEIAHTSGRFFTVIGVKVEVGGREVSRWSQPLLEQKGVGIVAFITQRRNGVLHFLVGAKVEPGNFDIVELGPTLSCSNADERAKSENTPLFFDRILSAPRSEIRHCSIQSEEGGRFYHFQNRYLIIEAPETELLDEPPSHRWMTMRQIEDFMKFSNIFSIEARGLLSCLDLCIDSHVELSSGEAR